MIHGLFPIPLGVYDFDREITSDEIAAVQSLKYYTNHGNHTSENTSIFDLEALCFIRQFAEQSIATYCKEAYAMEDKVEVYITQSWANCTKPTGWHHLHKHANSIVSGVFYIETNNDDSIHFQHEIPFNPIITYHLPIKDYNAYNDGCWVVPAMKGRLYLFPSCLEHEVTKVQGNKDRWSISFNTFIRGEIGEKKALTHLVL
jgi:uncharacterized protein (TIGR02466 family)